MPSATEGKSQPLVEKREESVLLLVKEERK